MIDKNVLLFKQDLENFPTTALKTLQQYLRLPDVNREDLVWLIAIHQAQKSQKATFPMGESLSTIAAGVGFSAGILEDKSILVWGIDKDKLTPTESLEGQVIQIAAGDIYLLALLENGTVVGWGENSSGQITVPDNIQGHVIQIAAGTNHSLALLDNYTVVGWGDKFSDQITVPDNIQGHVIQVAAGFNYSLALLDDHTVVGWGDSPRGIQSLQGKPVIQISAGEYYALALLEDGSMVGWGNNYTGQLNIPTFDKQVIQIAAGAYHSLALLEDHNVVGWGGHNPQDSIPPTAIQGEVIKIAAGWDHSLALLKNGSVVGWGDNYNGQSTAQEGPFLVPLPMIKSASKR